MLARNDRRRRETDCHAAFCLGKNADVGHWLAMTGDGGGKKTDTSSASLRSAPRFALLLPGKTAPGSFPFGKSPQGEGIFLVPSS